MGIETQPSQPTKTKWLGWIVWQCGLAMVHFPGLLNICAHFLMDWRKCFNAHRPNLPVEIFRFKRILVWERRWAKRSHRSSQYTSVIGEFRRFNQHFRLGGNIFGPFSHFTQASVSARAFFLIFGKLSCSNIAFKYDVPIQLVCNALHWTFKYPRLTFEHYRISIGFTLLAEWELLHSLQTQTHTHTVFWVCGLCSAFTFSVIVSNFIVTIVQLSLQRFIEIDVALYKALSFSGCCCCCCLICVWLTYEMWHLTKESKPKHLSSPTWICSYRRLFQHFYGGIFRWPK